MVTMRAIDKKLLRELRRLLPQSIAIALVLASGVATLVLATGAYRSLDESRTAYYERNAFADIFASATRAPLGLQSEIEAIPGVEAAEARIVRQALLDLPGVVEPATGLAVSLDDRGVQRLNRLHIREGRLPEFGRTDEVTINEAFATAHGFRIGSRFDGTFNGRVVRLTVVGIALAPEFIYAIGPGDLMPDDRRYGVLWMSRKALASLFDLDGAFNSVTVKLQKTAIEADVVAAIDRLLARYGGTGAFPRRDQTSHAFIDAELKQLAALARIMPPIFLLVAAFLINITLSRLTALEREQIGLLKALGYPSLDIALHYIKLVLVISALGLCVGFTVGTLLGRSLTRLYGEFFHFPILIFNADLDTYVVAGVVSLGAALVGALGSVRIVLKLPAAVAMQPPTPPRYDHLGAERWLTVGASPIAVMAVRHMMRWPRRALLSMLGLALAIALLVASLQSFDSVERMIDIAFYKTDRQDATLTFNRALAPAAALAAVKLPGVLRVEPQLAVPVRLIHGSRTRRVVLLGKPADMDLSRALDLELLPIRLPPDGVVLSQRVAELLAARPGDRLDVEVLDGKRGRTSVTVSDVVQSYFGLAVFMDIDALARITGLGPRVTSVHLRYDPNASTELFQAIKVTPAIASIGLQKYALRKFRATLAQNINYMVGVYLTLAVVISFGITYNAARIQLSERARELATLRVLGFSSAETARVLFTELAILAVAAVPVGWALGYLFAWVLIQSFSSDLYRAPFTLMPATYATAALIVLGASVVSALVVRRRMDGLDLIAVLKSRD